ncbi:MAG: hypothetical protein JW757_04700 [Anaerolineales bacterium]|nr:hypothetical protein [Anaerolineales bacterium]
MDLEFSIIYGCFAILSAAATVTTFVTGILFFYAGDQFGKLNDIASIFQVILMLPLTILFVQLLPDWFAVWAVLAALVGAAGMLISAYGQGLLVFERINFNRSQQFFPSGAAIGLWLLTVNALALASSLLTPVLAWIGVAAGLGYILTVIGFLRSGQSSPLFSIGALLLGIAYPAWAVWLGMILH